MNQKNSDSFLILCKELFMEGATPSGILSNEKYTQLVAIAKKYFDGDEYEEFAQLCQEGQYDIQ